MSCHAISPRIRELQCRVEAGDTAAVESFWHRLTREGTPLLEEVEGDREHVLLTLVWRAERPVRNVVVVPGLECIWNPDSNQLERVPGTDLWHRTWKVRSDLHTTYCFSPDEPLRPLHEMGPEEEAAYVQERMKAWRTDALNPRHFSPNPALPPMSVIELPDAPGCHWTARRPDVPEGRLEQGLFRHAGSGRERTFWLYRPLGEATPDDAALLVLCDGEGHLELGVMDVLDNLVADGRVPPLVCLLLHHPAREDELTCNDGFVDELATELLPRVRGELRLSTRPERTVLGGWSYGGLAAAFAGLRHPEVFGNVLSQSGSFWWAPEDAEEHEWLTARFAAMPRKDVRFYLNVGLLERGPSPGNSPSQLVANRHLRDVLKARGYDVTYRELNGGHDYIGWPGGLADGLMSLLGREV
ncbi:enterochelin esterase [Pyxidicoccus parkwayensis]|uniref:Enterochelin esterase n=1 Tax=Pyxidicoccus parkwayensis TaxID=2813578 RepID=A0ABX7NWH5_9BACT|nr:enterochelin esterase [Pyxidicoccus parkwaysis]QSQ23282.1 enterochelin esterase [Pyxidicoccus parkwaysis]